MIKKKAYIKKDKRYVYCGKVVKIMGDLAVVKAKVYYGETLKNKKGFFLKQEIVMKFSDKNGIIVLEEM